VALVAVSDLAVVRALLGITRALHTHVREFALVGGLAVSERTQPRFTGDIDVAVTVSNDDDAEGLVRDLGAAGYRVLASVAHEARKRLSTVRLSSPERVLIELLFASCGIEPEIVDRAGVVDMTAIGEIPVARAEDLLAMKILSMDERRLQDRIDAQQLVMFVPTLDWSLVRSDLETITQRGFHREQDLAAKLAKLVEETKAR
jgi:hypothetical protein